MTIRNILRWPVIAVYAGMMGCGAAQTESDRLDDAIRLAVDDCGEYETLGLADVAVYEAMALAYQLDRVGGAPDHHMMSEEARPGIERKLCFLDFNKNGWITRKEYDEGANLLSIFPIPKGE